MRPGSGSPAHLRARGFAYVMLLAVVAVAGLGLAALGPMWSEREERARERELLRIGATYASALASYYVSSPGSDKQFPRDLAELTLDTRFVGVRRHLRRLYADPLDPGRPWGLMRDSDGGIIGIYSLDERQPWLRVTHADGVVTLRPAARYREWIFSPRVP